MNGFSTVDGFVEITELLAEMIKFMANEPSLGLFYVQKHTQNAVPNVVNLSNHVITKSSEATLHAEDMEDSITMVKSMKEYGFAIADNMIKDITNSLTLISAKQAKRGLIRSPGSSSSSSSGFQMRRVSSWGPMMSWGQGSGVVEQDGTNYFLTVIKSARQKASNFKWPLPQSDEPRKPFPCHDRPPLSVASASISVPDAETDELTLSSQMADELHEEEDEEESFTSENYDDFKADKESDLEQWLGGIESKMDKSKGESDTGVLQLDRLFGLK